MIIRLTSWKHVGRGPSRTGTGWKPDFQDTASAGKMPTGPTGSPQRVRPAADRMALLQYLAEGGDAFPVLLRRADGDADPFRQVVAFHCPHDHFALKQGVKNHETIANLHQNKICGARDERKFHCG